MYVNRITPAVGAQHYQTYALKRPTGAAFWRENLRCIDVECDPMRLGWRTSIDEGTQLGQSQAHYIRRESGRSFTEARHPVSRLTVFTFGAGQACFQDGRHRAQLEREPLYVVRGGDWRGNPTGRQARIHTRAADWVDDFAGNQDRIKTVHERG